jgi:hypothetical protein
LYLLFGLLLLLLFGASVHVADSVPRMQECNCVVISILFELQHCKFYRKYAQYTRMPLSPTRLLGMLQALPKASTGSSCSATLHDATVSVNLRGCTVVMLALLHHLQQGTAASEHQSAAAMPINDSNDGVSIEYSLLCRSVELLAALSTVAGSPDRLQHFWDWERAWHATISVARNLVLRSPEVFKRVALVDRERLLAPIAAAIRTLPLLAARNPPLDEYVVTANDAMLLKRRERANKDCKVVLSAVARAKIVLRGVPILAADRHAAHSDDDSDHDNDSNESDESDEMQSDGDEQQHDELDELEDVSAVESEQDSDSELDDGDDDDDESADE